MNVSYPHTIENCIGEKLTFLSLDKELNGERLNIENYVPPGKGPLMHTHWHQDECLTVITGRIGYQIVGGPKQFAEVGESVFFERGTPHRFWNAGTDTLHCKGYIKPAHSIVFFLSAVFAAQNKSGSERPEKFDGAYLITKYKSEYDFPEIPSFVKKVIMPVTVLVGKVLGKYKHFEDAPSPLKIR